MSYRKTATEALSLSVAIGLVGTLAFSSYVFLPIDSILSALSATLLSTFALLSAILGYSSMREDGTVVNTVVAVTRGVVIWASDSWTRTLLVVILGGSATAAVGYLGYGSTSSHLIQCASATRVHWEAIDGDLRSIACEGDVEVKLWTPMSENPVFAAKLQCSTPGHIDAPPTRSVGETAWSCASHEQEAETLPPQSVYSPEFRSLCLTTISRSMDLSGGFGGATPTIRTPAKTPDAEVAEPRECIQLEQWHEIFRETLEERPTSTQCAERTSAAVAVRESELREKHSTDRYETLLADSFVSKSDCASNLRAEVDAITQRHRVTLGALQEDLVEAQKSAKFYENEALKRGYGQ